MRTTLAGAAALSGASLSAAEQPQHWKLGVITDEADFNLAHVLRDFIPKYNLHWVEIRELAFDHRRVYVAEKSTPTELRQIREQLQDANLRLSVLDTAVYKIDLPGTHGRFSPSDKNKNQGEYSQQMDLLKRAADAAHQLGTKKLRIFGFLRVDDPASVFNRVVDELHKALRVAAQHDVELVFENESSTNIATGAETAKLFQTISDRRLCHNWDPGNAFDAGETPYPDGWNQLDHSRICHIHLKDAVKTPDGKNRWMPIGGGQIDYIGQFRALKQINYAGTMSLETHYENAQHDKWTSSIESMDGLMRVLHQVS